MTVTVPGAPSRDDFPPHQGGRLHVGCGDKRLEGWINIDLLPLPTVDVVADITKDFDFRNAEAIFAEHFLEHLALDDAIRFLGESHRALMPGGWIRLSTPNLDWVWATHYDFSSDDAEQIQRGLLLNRAFRGWGHQFLWNRELLQAALSACGFDRIRWCRYGESDLEIFRGLERHETYPDADGLQHVLIVEASRGDERPDELETLLRRFNSEFLDHLERRFGTSSGAAAAARSAFVRLERSASFRIGRAITAPGRWLRDRFAKRHDRTAKHRDRDDPA